MKCLQDDGTCLKRYWNLDAKSGINQMRIGPQNRLNIARKHLLPMNKFDIEIGENFRKRFYFEPTVSENSGSKSGKHSNNAKLE